MFICPLPSLPPALTFKVKLLILYYMVFQRVTGRGGEVEVTGSYHIILFKMCMPCFYDENGLN